MGILFDLDGTLLDTAPEFFAGINLVRKELGMPPLPASKLPDIRNTVTFGIKALTTEGFKDQFQSLKDTDTKHSELCEQFLSCYRENLGSFTKPFPGVMSLLETLEEREIPWGIVTNRKIALAEILVEKLKLKHRAACLIGGDTTANPKPHPEPLLYACQKINRLPQNCLYVGDAKSDIDAAKAAGMKCITALFGYVGDVELAKTWGADHLVEHADEILPLAMQWLK